MSEWKEVILSEITSRIGDGLHGTPVYDEYGDYYFINGNNLVHGKIQIKPDTKQVSFEEYLKHAKPISDRTILLSINGTIGNLAFYNGEKCILGKSACYLNVLNGIDTQFIYYTFLNNDFQSYIREVATGTTIPNVPLKGIRNYSFKLPPLPEQKAIASILSSLDDKIDLLHRQNATIERMSQTLFRQWFVEEAKEEWKIGKLSDFGKVITGKTPSTKHSELWGNDFQFITPTDYKNFGVYSIVSERSISDEGWEKSKGIQLPPNSIMVTCIGSDMGKICISQNFCITNQQINSLILNKEECLGYVYNYLKSQYELLRNMALGGTTMPIVNKTDFSNIEIPIPNQTTLKEFNNYWTSWSSKLKANQTQIRTLTTLRDTLLPKLMSGEVQVAAD